MAKATFAAGCFRHPQHVFDQIEGVNETWVGFMGGTRDNPTYEEVCYTHTGHAEVVHIDFDPDRVSYERLLDVFWEIHDPTQMNRQGPDVGTQYRSAIFTHDEAQTAAALASKQALADSGKYDRPIATAVEPAGTFWKAEDYHQKYFDKTRRGGVLSGIFGR